MFGPPCPCERSVFIARIVSAAMSTRKIPSTPSTLALLASAPEECAAATPSAPNAPAVVETVVYLRTANAVSGTR